MLMQPTQAIHSGYSDADADVFAANLMPAYALVPLGVSLSDFYRGGAN